MSGSGHSLGGAVPPTASDNSIVAEATTQLILDAYLEDEAMELGEVQPSSIFLVASNPVVRPRRIHHLNLSDPKYNRHHMDGSGIHRS